MAIIDRIKFDGMLNGKDWLIYRYPGESFVMGTQLIVGEGQVAVFVSGGQALDFFTAGTYKLSTSNIPLLQGLLNLPYGGKTPFTAEVYFINKTSKLDITWGTVDPIQLIDPKYNIKLRIRAFGQFGMKVEDFRVFLTELIGTLNAFDAVNYNKVLDYFKGVLVMRVKASIAEDIIKKQISALEISAYLDDISEKCKEDIGKEFTRFGLKVVNFYVQSINFPDEDFDKINNILADKASFDIIGDQRYVTKRSFDTMEKAASNESGTTGALVGAGVGLGAGMQMGRSVAPVAQVIDTSVPEAKKVACRKCGAENVEHDTFCGKCGSKLAAQTVKCSGCNAEVLENAKFCMECGTPVAKAEACPQCKTENKGNAKFCSECGFKLHD